MRYILRPYQLRALDDLRDRLRRGAKRLILVAPTGSGKTVCAAAMVEGAVARGRKVLFLAHRRELIEQCSSKLDDIGVDHALMLGHHWRTDVRKPVQVASVQTLARRAPPPADLVIIDEAHRCLAPSYARLIAEHYSASTLIGLSATPWRSDGRGLGAIYQDLVLTASVRDLVEQGYLVRSRIFAPHRPDLAGVHSVAGDYRQDELAAAVDKSRLVGDIVEHWRRLAEGRRTVVFAVGVEHSRHLAAAFVAAGIRAEHADGALPELARSRVIRRVRTGEVQVLTNCELVTEGFDVPELSCCVLARPTKSSVKYLQMVGRVARPASGKADALILDHAGCVFRHGFPADERTYGLEDQAPPKDDEAPVKICRECFAVMLSTARVCPECGAAVVVDSVGRKPPETQEGELAEILPGDLRTCRKCRSTDTHTFVGRGMGAFTTGIRCHACGATEFVTDHLRAHNASMVEKQAEYTRLSAIRERKGFAKGWVAHRYRALFGCWPRGVKDVDSGSFPEHTRDVQPFSNNS